MISKKPIFNFENFLQARRRRRALRFRHSKLRFGYYLEIARLPVRRLPRLWTAGAATSADREQLEIGNSYQMFYHSPAHHPHNENRHQNDRLPE
jgi:hypothetical protein